MAVANSNVKLSLLGVSLLVEGGGMRGFYSAGILACLRERGLAFPHVVGVSSGALNATAYVAGKLELDFSRLGSSPTCFFTARGLVRPLEGLVKTDAFIDVFCGDCWEGVRAAAARGQELWVPATDAQTGELAWWGPRDFTDAQALRERLVASASIPFVMPQARVDGRVFADGGIRDSIPIDRAEALGFSKHVLILSRPRGYVKGAQHLELYLRHWLRPYPKLKEAMLKRHVYYNESARRVERIEDEGRAFVFRMDVQNLGRFEYSPAKFEACFEQGKRDAATRMGELEEFLDRA